MDANQTAVEKAEKDAQDIANKIFGLLDYLRLFSRYPLNDLALSKSTVLNEIRKTIYPYLKGSYELNEIIEKDYLPEEDRLLLAYNSGKWIANWQALNHLETEVLPNFVSGDVTKWHKQLQKELKG